jgi:EmrB/QacA subfamily drug resistance transporter
MDRKWWTLLAACTATFMLLLDITIVNVALPDIQKALGSSFSDLQWVIDAYSLMLASLLLTAGSLGDILGRRLVFASGLVLFTAASLTCALATGPLFLNLARGAQGIGGAIMFATSLALIAQEFQGRERGVAFGVWGATIGFAVAVGPLVGGALTEWLGWEWIFYLNLPIGAATLLVTLLRVPEAHQRYEAAIDWIGLVTFSGALFLLVLALIRGNDDGWTSAEIVGLLAGSAVLLATFVAAERMLEHPMFELRLFRIPTFTGGAVVAFTISASMFALFLYLTLYLQNVLGLSPLGAGLRFLPLSMISFFAAAAAGPLSERLPVRALLGGGLALAGAALLLMHGLSTSSTWTALLPGFCVAGVGIGMLNPPLASAAVGVVEPKLSGMASGISNTFRQVGVATGIAALGAVLQARVTAHVESSLRGMRGVDVGRVAHAVATGSTKAAIAQAPQSARAAIGHAARAAYIAGLNEILLVAAGVALGGAVLGFALVRRSDFVHHTQPRPRSQES